MWPYSFFSAYSQPWMSPWAANPVSMGGYYSPWRSYMPQGWGNFSSWGGYGALPQYSRPVSSYVPSWLRQPAQPQQAPQPQWTRQAINLAPLETAFARPLNRIQKSKLGLIDVGGGGGGR